MKGLIHIPSPKELEKAYFDLQTEKIQPSCTMWALWSQWARFDARLAEQMVQNIFLTWQNISPIELNQALQSHPWPQSFGVLLSNAKMGFKGRNPDKKKFQAWVNLAMFGISKANFEQYFIGTMALGGARMLKEVLHTTKPYLQWGYLGKDILWNKNEAKNFTISNRRTRLAILKQLIQKKKIITVKDYIQELDGNIHIRQAQRDLKDFKKIKSRGKTNNRIYYLN
jgi:hypothetical protein